MNREEIKKIVIETVKDRLGLKTVNETDDFYKDLGCDSLDAIELQMQVERRIEAGVAISDDKWYGVTTVGDAISVIDQTINGTALQPKVSKKPKQVSVKITCDERHLASFLRQFANEVEENENPTTFETSKGIAEIL